MITKATRLGPILHSVTTSQIFLHSLPPAPSALPLTELESHGK